MPATDLAALLQEFVDARIGPAELFSRAEGLLPAGSDSMEEVLTWLAESEEMLRLPTGHRALAQRLREFADQEISWDELDLWAFALEHTEALSPDRPAATPQVALLREVLSWIEEWQEEDLRPSAARLRLLADILQAEPEPGRCLARLEEALESA
jgi:hypothetical protein